jgi:hypothetical protein
VADRARAETRRETLLAALKCENVNSPPVLLINDGGPENKLKDFIAQEQLPMEHRTALVDVHYSNSMIEAINKTIKYNYLYRKDISDGEQLKEVMQWSVENFNGRPHVSHRGLTPNKRKGTCYLTEPNISGNIKQAITKRKIQNAQFVPVEKLDR